MRYDYECKKEDCQFEFEVEQRISARRLRKCPACGSKSLERIILQAPMSYMAGRTIGTLADRQTSDLKQQSETKRLLDAKQTRIDAVRKKMPEGAILPDNIEHKPWYGKLSKKMASETSSKKLHNYIMKGKE